MTREADGKEVPPGTMEQGQKLFDQCLSSDVGTVGAELPQATPSAMEATVGELMGIVPVGHEDDARALPVVGFRAVKALGMGFHAGKGGLEHLLLVGGQQVAVASEDA